MLPQSLSLSKN